MRIIRFVTMIAAILGAAIGLVGVGLLNWVFNIHLSFGSILMYGIAGGVLFGIIAGYLAVYYIARRARRFIFNKFASGLSSISFLRKL